MFASFHLRASHLTFLLGALLTATTASSAAAQAAISGALEKGLRILSIPSDSKRPAATLKFTVYRGDYVKFRFDEKLGELAFSMPELKYHDKVVGSPEKAKNLYKMTKVGTFPFTLGKRKGELTIVEYDQANYKAVTPFEAKDLLVSVKPLILDVRSRAEVARGRLENAVVIPVDELQLRHGELDRYKNEDVFIYCASGNRSTVAAQVLISKGFKRIYNLRGGFSDLESMGLPTAR